MPGIILRRSLCADEKVALMQQDARFDVADPNEAVRENALADCMAIRSPKAIPKVPKVFLGNDCIFNCAYCDCRCGNEEKRRYALAPRELAEIAVSQAQKDRRGIFLTSAIIRDPNYTQELIIETLRVIRKDHLFRGYVHAKVMPGADPGLIRQAGGYADRLSVNIEVAKSEGYVRVAKNKNKRNILEPMSQISAMIRAAKETTQSFATSQTTQLMAGSVGEDDRTILELSSALYRKFSMSRVYYTAFQYIYPAKGYDALPLFRTPHWRMRRLYQADRLMQLYGFAAEEIAPECDSNLMEGYDPKVRWALRNLHLFPIEINLADYETLLRIPGIGVIGAKRIIKARQTHSISHDILRELGISQKRCRHFITCCGRFTGMESKKLPTILYEGPNEPTCEQLMLAI